MTGAIHYEMAFFLINIFLNVLLLRDNNDHINVLTNAFHQPLILEITWI